MKEIIWFYDSFLVLLFSFFPGYLILRATRRFEKSLCVTLSFGVTAFLISATYLFCRSLDFLWSSHESFKLAWLILFCLVVGIAVSFQIFSGKSSFLVIRTFSWSSLRVSRTQWEVIPAIYVVQYLLKICLQTMIPVIMTGGDWYEHFERARFFLNRQANFSSPFQPWSIADRTPLFNILGAFFMALLSDEYWVFQAVSVLYNSIILFPAFLIADHIFDRRTAILSVLFITLNPNLTENTLYTWPKNLAAYFILTFYYLLMRDSYSSVFIAGPIIALAFLSHGYTFLFLVGGLVFIVLKMKEKSFKDAMKRIFFVVTGFFVFIAPWLNWTREFSHSSLGSRQMYYPFCVNGPTMVLHNTPDEIQSIFLSTPLETILSIRLSNIYRTLFPWPLISYLQGELETVHEVIWLLYANTLPSAVGLVLFVLASVAIVREVTIRKEIVSFILVPFLSSVIFWGWISIGLVRQTLHPLIPLLIILSVGYLLKRVQHRQSLLLLSWLSQCFDTGIYIIWLHIYRISLKASRTRPDVFIYISTAWEEFAWHSTPLLSFGLALVSWTVLCMIFSRYFTGLDSKLSP